MGYQLKQEKVKEFKIALKRKGYHSQQQLAEETGISLSTVKTFAKGTRGNGVNYANFTELCHFLGWDVEDSLAPANDKVELTDKYIPPTASFTPNLPIKHPRNFFGREAELKLIFRYLKQHPLQHIAIVGKRQSGKTSLLRYLQQITRTDKNKLRPNQKYDWLERPELYQWIFVDFLDSDKRRKQTLINYLLHELEIPQNSYNTSSNFIDIISRNLNLPTIILMDSFDKVFVDDSDLDYAFWCNFRSLLSNQCEGNLSLILSSNKNPSTLYIEDKPSPFLNIFATKITLNNLTESEAKDLILSSPIQFSEEDIQWIIDKSDCLPHKLQILCQKRLISLENGEENFNWREEELF